jgi:hypothetical protein
MTPITDAAYITNLRVCPHLQGLQQNVDCSFQNNIDAIIFMSVKVSQIYLNS